MKNNLLLAAAICLGATALSAQEKTAEAPKNDTVKAWSVTGQNTLLLNQAAFPTGLVVAPIMLDGLPGSITTSLMRKVKDLWENNVILGYGQNNTKGTGNRKTQDILNLNTNYGREFAKTGTSPEV